MDIHTLATYLPQDRLRALARGERLPDRTSGAALFADISGFTPLTETLVRTLGPRRGAEKLILQLNHVYDTLIALVNCHGGSVIHFVGDAFTCWFDDASSVEREPAALSATACVCAVACALEMQAAMQAFAQIPIPSGGVITLAIKIAVASGPARHWVVGDPDIQLLDVLAGATLARMAAAEHVAKSAHPAYLEGLQLGQEVGDKRCMLYGFLGLAAVAALHSDWPRAVQLAAVIETLRLQMDLAWEPREGHRYQLILTQAQVGLGQPPFRAAWAEGAKMPLDEAVAYALGRDQDAGL